MVCMASVLSSNGRISAYYDNVWLKISRDAYFMAFFHFMRSKYTLFFIRIKSIRILRLKIAKI